ncbi:MAG: AAA family ATPase, partial [Nocardioides sp.]
MRLASFTVKTFRNVIDSTLVEVDDVTCLVGKNESGKSAIMQALHALNPAKPAQVLDLLDEYPRWLKKEHEITGQIGSAVPITATFSLTAEEMAELTAQFGVEVLSEPSFTASRSYAKPSAISVDAPINDATFVELFVGERPARLAKALGKSIGTSLDLITALKNLAEHADGDGADTSAIATDATEALHQLWEITGGVDRNLRVAVDDWLRERMPRTFYFSTYSQLNGRYNLAEVFDAVQNGSDDDAVQAAADFLTLARAVPEAIEEWDYEASNAELEAISSLLTKRVKEHWRQNDHLKLRVSLEPEKYTDPSTGQVNVRRWLQFRVEDERHDFSNRLDRRSTGFQWFISFLAAFLEFEQDKNLILLLDEPGLSLHARAQLDLLAAIETKLATSRQVIYSTHSPFMVESSSLNHARIVE